METPERIILIIAAIPVVALLIWCWWQTRKHGALRI